MPMRHHAAVVKDISCEDLRKRERGLLYKMYLNSLEILKSVFYILAFLRFCLAVNRTTLEHEKLEFTLMIKSVNCFSRNVRVTYVKATLSFRNLVYGTFFK